MDSVPEVMPDLELEDYPNYPCVGCGYCCRKVQCGWSLREYGELVTCPELVQEQAVWRCKAANNPELAAAVGIGAGCCSPMNSDRGKHAVTLTEIMGDGILRPRKKRASG